MLKPHPVPVLFVHSGRDWIRGSERCLLDLMEGLDRHAFVPSLVCDAPTLAREAARLDVEVELAQVAERVVPRARDVRSLWKSARRSGARLVHANVGSVIGPLLPVVRALRVPLVAHVHITPTLPDRRHSWLHQVTTAVGVARHVVAGLQDDGMPPERIRVIYNGIDPSRLDDSGSPPARGALGIAHDALVLGSVGSLIARKGHDVTIRALAALRARGVDAHLVVCGDGEAEGLLRELATALGVAEHTHLLGLRRDVGAVVRGLADVFVSAAHDEAFPLNVLEAQYLGRAVVASDIAAHHEAIVPGSTGLLFRDGSAEDLATRLELLAGSPEDRARFGAVGHARVRDHFLIDRYRREFYALYDDLLAAPASRYGWLRGSTWPATYTPWVRSIALRRLGRAGEKPLAAAN